MPKKQNSNFPKPNASFLSKPCSDTKVMWNVFVCWKSVTKYSITLHQHETIVGKKMLKLIQQIDITK